MARWPIAVPLAVGVLSGWPGQTPQAPVFRAKAEVVEVHAVVTDRAGAIVRGLSRDDFTVAEDGKAQELVLFSFVDMPAPQPSAPAGRQAAPRPIADVATNALPADRRLYVIVLDASNVDASRSTVTKRLARQFIEDSLGPNDLASVIQLGRTAVNQPFTSNKALLVAALDQFIGHKPQSATNNLLRDAMQRPQKPAEDYESGARANEARRMLESLKQICESLGATRGYRRSLILFSEGVDFDTSDLIGADQRPAAGGQGLVHEPAKHAGFVLQAQQDLYVAAKRAGVAVYPIDPRGNTMGEDLQMQVSSSPGLGLMNEVQRGQGVLRTLAEQTGGLAVVSTGAFKAGFESIVEANSSYYVLAYSPSNAARDGTYRRIAVSVRRPDVTVTTRKGYVAPADAPATAPPAAAPAPNAASPRMREILASALPVAGLPLRLTGGPIKPQGDKMLIAFVLEIDTRALPFTEQGGLLANDIELAFLAMNASGRMLAGTRTVGNLKLPPAQRAGLDRVRYAVEFPAPPGRYQLRVAVHESAGDSGGSALLDLDVPDPSRAPLSVGTILVASSETQGVPTTGNLQLVKALLPALPSAAREFGRTDTLAVFASVFDASAKRTDSIEVSVVAQGADGREAFKGVATRTGADISPGQGGYGHTAGISLAGFAPGTYVLTVGARSSSGKTATKAVTFVVR